MKECAPHTCARRVCEEKTSSYAPLCVPQNKKDWNVSRETFQSFFYKLFIQKS